MENGYWFRSSQFHVQDGEDELTNPGRYGKALAEWLAGKFSALGYEAELIAEDWGWCVMCLRGDYLLWIACSNVTDAATLEGTAPRIQDAGDIVWHVFTVIEIPFFKVGALLKKWRGRLDLATPRDTLNQQLDSVLKANDAIVLCEEP